MAREFGIIKSRFWHSPSVRQLSDDGKVLALYLMTTSHGNIAGVFRCTVGYVADDLCWGSERVSEGFDELSMNGFAYRCGTTDWVWITNHLVENPLANPNQVKSARRLAKGIPHESAWRPRFLKAFGPLLGFLTDESTGAAGTVPERFTNGSRIQRAITDHIPDQESDQETERPPKELPGDLPENEAQPVAEAPAPGEQRGTRLPKGWELTSEFREWAVANMPRWTDDTAEYVAGRFRDFWIAKTGKDATKLDWFATWRNWCKGERVPADKLKPEKSASSDAVREAARQKLFGMRSGGREVIDA